MRRETPVGFSSSLPPSSLPSSTASSRGSLTCNAPRIDAAPRELTVFDPARARVDNSSLSPSRSHTGRVGFAAASRRMLSRATTREDRASGARRAGRRGLTLGRVETPRQRKTLYRIRRAGASASTSSGCLSTRNVGIHDVATRLGSQLRFP